MILLDSSALIEILHDTEKGKNAVSLIGDEIICIAAFSIYEVMFSIKERERNKIEIVKMLNVLDFDKRAALKSIEIEKQLMREGRLIKKIDIFISAICAVNDLRIITADEDFRNVGVLEAIIL